MALIHPSTLEVFMPESNDYYYTYGLCYNDPDDFEWVCDHFEPFVAAHSMFGTFFSPRMTEAITCLD